MIILFVLFLLQFALACACLAVNAEQKDSLARQGWQMSEPMTKDDVQHQFNCCGFEEQNLNVSYPLGHPACQAVIGFFNINISLYISFCYTAVITTIFVFALLEFVSAYLIFSLQLVVLQTVQLRAAQGITLQLMTQLHAPVINVWINFGQLSTMLSLPLAV